MAVKLAEQTNGTHIFMRLRLDSGRVEEIDAYTTEKGWHYIMLMWLDPEHDLQFTLDAPLGQEDILHIAESVHLVETMK